MSKLKGVAEYGEEEEEYEEEEEEDESPKKGDVRGKEVKTMTKETPVSFTQLATRVDSTLFRRIKIHCVETNTSIMEFVHSALVAELKKRKK